MVRGDSLLIVLGDMLRENGYKSSLAAHHKLDSADASVGVKTVEEPQHYGVAELGDWTRVDRLDEKLNDPQSNHAISEV